MTWKKDGTDNDTIRAWLSDPQNEGNCEECPYIMRHPGHDALPCGQQHCWVTLLTEEG